MHMVWEFIRISLVTLFILYNMTLLKKYDVSPTHVCLKHMKWYKENECKCNTPKRRNTAHAYDVVTVVMCIIHANEWI